jgi:DNA primase
LICHKIASFLIPYEIRNEEEERGKGNMRFSPEVIEQIRNSIYLPDLVRRYTHLTKNNKALCPFHKEKNPSLSIDAQRGLWHCFGCCRGGDVFSFIMEAEHLTFPDAVKFLAFEAGIRLPESDTIKDTLSKKCKERQEKIDKLNYLEELFKDYENQIYDYLRFEIKSLPPKEKRMAKDYLKELLIEEKFERLDALVNKRTELFEDMRRKVRHE